MTAPQVVEKTNNTDEKATLLIVDDETSVLKSLKRVFHGLPYRLVLADTAKKALAFMEDHKVQVVISDMRMPDMPGNEFLAQVAMRFSSTYRIVLSGYSDTETTLSAINEGRIHRYLQKPWDNQGVVDAVNEGLTKYRLEKENARLQKQTAVNNKKLKEINTTLEQKVEFRTLQIKGALNKAERSVVALKKAIYNTVSINPQLSGAFAKSLSKLAEQIAVQLKVDMQTLSDIRYAGLISEVGATGMPHKVINTPLNSLSGSDQKIFYKQAECAEMILSPVTQLQTVSDILRSQFEFVNGQGYNAKLSKDDIPIGSRIIAVARDYLKHQDGRIDATKCNAKESLKKLNQFSGIQYDENVLKALAVVVGSQESVSEDIGISTSDLTAGMVLQEPLFNKNDILVLPEGHVFDEASIKRLISLEKRFDMYFSMLAS